MQFEIALLLERIRTNVLQHYCIERFVVQVLQIPKNATLINHPTFVDKFTGYVFLIKLF